MVYAHGRVFHDADSHIMELPNFMSRHADAALLADIKDLTPVWRGELDKLPEHAAVTATGRHEPVRLASLLALGDDLINGPKGFDSLGAFNTEERTTALDMLGFSSQLVFPTFCLQIVFAPDKPLEWRYRAAHAHNLGMAEFCAGDKRLKGVGCLPLDDVPSALKEIDHILELGLAAALIPAQPPGDRSPGHSDLDVVWAKLADAGLPFVLHIGTHDHQADPRYRDNGRAPPSVGNGGGEVVGGKDIMALSHPFEVFIGALVLDGVLERHPTLKGAVVEVGAGWVPALLRRLDWAARLWSKTTPEFAAFTRKPSEQIIDQLIFTPLVQEEVGKLIDESDVRLYAFSSDYPHPEGGRGPVERFEKALMGHSEAEKKRFYEENFLTVFNV